MTRASSQPGGGLGLRSAAASRFAAYWSSWADSMPVIGARHPRTLARIPGCRRPRGWGALGGRDGSLPAPPREGQSPEAQRRRARSRPASARFLPTLAPPLPGRRRRATSCATPAGRRTPEGACVSPQLDGKKRVRKKHPAHLQCVLLVLSQFLPISLLLGACAWFVGASCFLLFVCLHVGQAHTHNSEKHEATLAETRAARCSVAYSMPPESSVPMETELPCL